MTDVTGSDDAEGLRTQLDETRRLLVAAEAEARQLRAELERYETSNLVRVVKRLQALAHRAAPYESRRQRALHVVSRSAATLVEFGPRAVLSQVRAKPRPDAQHGDTTAGRQRQYQEWLRRTQPDAAQLEAQREESRTWHYRPLISVVMPVHDPDVEWLQAAIASVCAQTYDNWELRMADDCSKQPAVRLALENAATHARITVSFGAHPAGIAKTTNAAIERAAGEFIAFLDHDDILQPHALHAVVQQLQRDDPADIVYSDHDKLPPDGARCDPFFKPDYSPELLLSWNYMTHLVVMRKQLLDDVGGLREGFEGSQDHDLLLRGVERARQVAHIPDVLYSWRMVEGSAALSSDYKPLAREAGRRAVTEAVRRRGETAEVRFGEYPGLYNVRYEIQGEPTVHIVIPTRDRVRLLRQCVDSIERLSSYRNYHITIVDNGSSDRRTLAYLSSTRHRVFRHPGPFNFSAIVNKAADGDSSGHLLLLNNDCVVLSPQWIEALLEQSQRRDVGAVGARLLFPDGRVQHEGIIVGGLHTAANVEMRWPVAREVSAVTGACLMTRTSIFRDVGGFDEELREAFNDVDYCLRLRAKGYRVIFTPYATLRHHEGGTRGRRTPSEDEELFVARWGSKQTLRDPYVNRNVLWPNPLVLRLD
jgi:GT2 family glycosyltransferase